MNGKSLLCLAPRPLTWLALLAALLAGAWAWHCHRGPRRVDVTGWDIPRLVSHLRSRGLALRVVSTMADSDSRRYTAFLTTTELEFDELNALPRDLKQIAAWRGTVSCAIIDDAERRAGEEYGMEGCFLERGHFALRGDPDLLARIAAALGEGNGG